MWRGSERFGGLAVWRVSGLVSFRFHIVLV